MHRRLKMGFTVTISLLFLMLVAPPVSSAIQDPASMKKTFFEKAAQGQQAEIALGQLVMQKASNEQVKQFGQRMIADHRKANREMQQFAANEDILIPGELSAKQQQKQQELSRLSGTEFDRSYIGYMLRDHVKDVHEFKESAQMLQDPQVKQWGNRDAPVSGEFPVKRPWGCGKSPRHGGCQASRASAAGVGGGSPDSCAGVAWSDRGTQVSVS